MRNIKKTIYVFLFFFIIFLMIIPTCSTSSGGGGNDDDDDDNDNPPENSDMLPAVIDRIVLDKTSVDVPDVGVQGIINIKVFLKEGYDNSNIGDVEVNLYSPSQLNNNEGVILDEWLDYDGVEGCFEGSIEINHYQELGTWKINEIEIEDNTNDKECCYFIDSTMSNDYYSLAEDYGEEVEEVTEIEIIDVTVTGTTPDLDFPVMTAYTITPAVVNDNETVTITINVSDPGAVSSGIEDVYADIRIELDGGGYILGASYDEIVAGQYLCKILMESTDPDGTWYIDEIEIEDNAGNTTTYEYEDEYDSEHLIMYHNDNEDNFTVTAFDVKSFVKN